MPIDNYLDKLESSGRKSNNPSTQFSNNQLNDRVTYFETPAYEITRKLREKGYEIADSSGHKLKDPWNDVVTILKPQNPIQKNFIGIKWKKKQRSIRLGTLWLDNEGRGANIHRNWVLEAYGRENLQELTILVDFLAKSNNVHIMMNLVDEKTWYEQYWGDPFD